MTALNREQIIALEQSDRKYVRAKKIYIDMAGDLIAGIVLSEVVYWHTPGKGGKQRLRTIEGQSDKWLACRRQGWWDRARITARQFDRALDKLVKSGLIIRNHFDYKGQSTLHVRINWEIFEKLYNTLLEVPAQRKRRTGITKQSHPEVLPDGDTLSPDGNTDLPTGETDSPHGDTYTIIDTTIDTKTEKPKEIATSPFVGMKNAIQKAFGWDKPTETEWGQINKAASQLVKVDIVPDDIASLHGYCKSQTKGNSFTPLFLASKASDWKKQRPARVVPEKPIEKPAPAPEGDELTIRNRQADIDAVIRETAEKLGRKKVAA